MKGAAAPAVVLVVGVWAEQSAKVEALLQVGARVVGEVTVDVLVLEGVSRAGAASIVSWASSAVVCTT